MSDPAPPYTYRATLVRVVDADTAWLRVELGFRVAVEQLEIRLANLDAPKASTVLGKSATAFATQWFADHPTFLVDTRKTEKWGRWLAMIYVPDEPSLNDALIAANLAMPWQGQGPHPTGES